MEYPNFSIQHSVSWLLLLMTWSSLGVMDLCLISSWVSLAQVKCLPIRYKSRTGAIIRQGPPVLAKAAMLMVAAFTKSQAILMMDRRLDEWPGFHTQKLDDSKSTFHSVRGIQSPSDLHLLTAVMCSQTQPVLLYYSLSCLSSPLLLVHPQTTT